MVILKGMNTFNSSATILTSPSLLFSFPLSLNAEGILTFSYKAIIFIFRRENKMAAPTVLNKDNCRCECCVPTRFAFRLVQSQTLTISLNNRNVLSLPYPTLAEMSEQTISSCGHRRALFKENEFLQLWRKIK